MYPRRATGALCAGVLMLLAVGPARSDAADFTPVADDHPDFVLTPVGTAAVSSLGAWRGGNLTLTPQWQRCAPDGSACADIPGATGNTYPVGDDSIGKTIRLAVSATNSAGTTRAYSTSFGLPNTAIASGPQAMIRVRTARFDLAASRTGATFECKLDGGAFAACSDPATLTGLREGVHTLYVRAVYGGLRDATPATYHWTVDTISPETWVIGGPATFDLSGGATYDCAVDDGAFAACPDPVIYPYLPEGPHTLFVRARDAVGNVDKSPAAIAFVTPPPTLTAELPGDATVRGRTLTVGCEFDGALIEGCTVRAYVDDREIATGHVRPRGTHTGTRVDVALNALGRRLLRRHPEGVKARMVVHAKPVGGKAMRTRLYGTLVPQTRTLTTPYDGFEGMQASLRPATRRWLRRLVPTLTGSTTIRCTGHTSGLGSERANEALGQVRAQAVCDYLRASGVRTQFTVVSAGETQPVATNRTVAGRKRNRRVEILARR